MKLPFTIEQADKYTLIRLKGDKLDSLVAPTLKAQYIILNADGIRNIIIDFSEIRYCDSSGLSAILVANRLCKNSNRLLVLFGLQEPVKKLISISQLDSILNITSDLSTAIDRLVVEDVPFDSGN